jgi:hypothetical protein
MVKSKINLKKAKQTDGKVRKEELTEDSNPQYEPTTLAQLWGESNGSEKYKTLKIEEYKESLANMNLSELQSHALEIAQVVPIHQRERLEKRLCLEFQRHVAGFTVPKITHRPEKPASQEALRIMAEVK